MRLSETFVLYSAIGVACGVAFVRQPVGSSYTKVVKATLSLLFWPLLLPLLLPFSSRKPRTLQHWEPGPYHASIEALLQGVSSAIELTEQQSALSLDRERGAMEKLSSHLYRWDERIAELDSLLCQPDFDVEHSQKILEERQRYQAESATESARIHLANIKKLHELREKLANNVEEALALLERVRSQVTLLRFTGDSPVAMKREMEDVLALVNGWDESLSSSLW